MGENMGEKEQAKEEDEGHLATPFLFPRVFLLGMLDVDYTLFN